MVADGYKDTEIGVIPIEWEVGKLENHINIISGQSPSKFDLTGSEYKFFKVNQLNFCEKYLTNSEYAFDEEIDNLLDSGTVIFPKRGASIFTNKVRILTHKSFIDTNLMGLITNNTLNNMFLYYWLIEFELSNIADTSSVPQINNKHINPLKIPLPPLKEQEKIADILTTADDKIDAIASQIQKAETLKKGLLQKLLSEGIGHSEFKDSELGEIPESWEVVQVKKLIKMTSGKFNPKKNLNEYQTNDFNFPVYGGNGITGYFTDSLIDFPTIIIGRVGEYCGSVHLETKPIWITDNAIYIKEINENIELDYLYSVFYSIGLENLAERTGQPKITQEPIYNLKIPLPPLEEQKQIANILSTADEKLEVLKAKKEKHETLKKGLLQKLLSGEVRV